MSENPEKETLSRILVNGEAWLSPSNDEGKYNSKFRKNAKCLWYAKICNILFRKNLSLSKNELNFR
jgi:hypothetical protein